MTMMPGIAGDVMMLAYVGGSSPAGLVELMLWGPRQVISGIAKSRVMRFFSKLDLIRESLVLQALVGRTRGVPVKELVKKGETAGDVLRALAYLAYYDWVGVSEKQDNAWALTDTRQEFKVG
jgi:hypothetical protein